MKHPSITKKVNYKDMVDELWKKKLSENREEDQLLKKTVVNVSFGVMEKQTNKAQKSKLFDSFEEAKFYAENSVAPSTSSINTRNTKQTQALTRSTRMLMRIIKPCTI